MAKNEINNANTATLFAMGIQTGGFKTRLVGYMMLYIPVAFVYFWIFVLSKGFGLIDFTKFLPDNSFGVTIALLMVLLPPALPFIFWERSIRSFRRKNGLSVYGNIREELEQREIDERVRKEHKAFVNNGIVKNGAVDKNDIGYWFGLFERGAITKEEYESKKQELL